MNPKIKMSDIHDDRDDDIIELTEDELKEILADDDFEDDGDYEEIRSFVFTNPDPYAKVEPRPDDAPKRDFSFDENGNIVVKNPSAFWLPEITITEDIGGTELHNNRQLYRHRASAQKAGSHYAASSSQ